MPTLRVWVKKTIPGPNGTIEIGLGGTHEIACEPHQVARERLALYQSYRDEVERLIDCELTGKPIAPPAPEPAARPQPEVEPSPLTRERSRQVLAELQERLAQRAKAREQIGNEAGSEGEAPRMDGAESEGAYTVSDIARGNTTARSESRRVRPEAEAPGLEGDTARKDEEDPW